MSAPPQTPPLQHNRVGSVQNQPNHQNQRNHQNHQNFQNHPSQQNLPLSAGEKSGISTGASAVGTGNRKVKCIQYLTWIEFERLEAYTTM